MLGHGMVEIDFNDEAAPKLESWIEAARRGDREALGNALISFRHYLLLVANDVLDRRLAAKAGASDVVQETFFLAHRSFRQFQGRSEAEWRTWLRTILVRRLAHHRRRYGLTMKRRQALEIPITPEAERGPASRDPSPSAELARRERDAMLQAAVGRLPEHYRDVVLQHHRDGVPFAEIGRRRGISAEASRKPWTRALARLRVELRPELGTP